MRYNPDFTIRRNGITYPRIRVDESAGMFCEHGDYRIISSNELKRIAMILQLHNAVEIMAYKVQR
jgi:hypothetical protein